MKKIFSRLLPLFVLILFLGALAPSNQAQTTVSATRVMTVPDGPQFAVDGQMFLHSMSAFWPVGSVHSLWVPSGGGFAYNADQTIQWIFQGWQYAGGALSGNPVTITADPSITQYQAIFNTNYRFLLQASCGGQLSCQGAPGVVLVNGQGSVFGQPSWQPASAAMTLQATPNPGWVFAGWQVNSSAVVAGFQDVVTMTGPTTVTAVFQPAKTVNFATSPVNLQLYADTTLITPPVSLPWGWGSTHTVGAIVTQQDPITKYWWVFSSWSDGGAPTHAYQVANNGAPETITANYVPGVGVYFYSSPPNLNLVVDGLSIPPPYGFIWGVGQTHHVVAPAQQTDAQGNIWAFSSWDDGVTTAARDVTPTTAQETSQGLRLLAQYTAQARLNITSTVAGLSVTVDGSPCSTPCSVTRNVGAQVRVSAPASVPVADGTRQDLLGWSVGGAAPAPGDWTGTLAAGLTSINATYHVMNHLSTVSNPPDGAAWNIAPQSPDGFYDCQTLVNLNVSAQPGYHFTNWSGDLSGSAPSASLMMNAPHSVLAQFSRVPYITPAGVTNAAGQTPQAGVAPASLATIFGANLAASTATAPPGQLPQTLAGVVVHIGSTYLPISYASPTQINFQLPPDLAAGPQVLTVSSLGMPDVSTNFIVVRDAPGIFPLILSGQSYAITLHEDGTLVTPDSPAKVGELLTVYGTGFGPTDNTRLAGMPVPSSPPYQVLDPVTVTVAGAVFTPENAIALAGQVGVDVVRFRLDSSAPSGSNAPLKLTINGVDSNTLPLPIQ
ncbi:MAG TPA: hypothetical protein VLY04_15615 [Bryobacteraceae bacterium]|nr:hypothetical protein [Bryobacteraceae bacterium]